MRALTIRTRRLNTDHKRIVDLARLSDLVEILESQGDPPEKYVLRFRCLGVASMDLSTPVLAKEHRAEIYLPRDYPAGPPMVRCLTPIFHPNIDSDNGRVCIDTWHAGRFLDELTIMLGRMIRYQNYNPASPLNPEASNWALEHRDLFPFDARPFRRGRQDQRTPQGFMIRMV